MNLPQAIHFLSESIPATRLADLLLQDVKVQPEHDEVLLTIRDRRRVHLTGHDAMPAVVTVVAWATGRGSVPDHPTPLIPTQPRGVDPIPPRWLDLIGGLDEAPWYSDTTLTRCLDYFMALMENNSPMSASNEAQEAYEASVMGCASPELDRFLHWQAGEPVPRVGGGRPRWGEPVHYLTSFMVMPNITHVEMAEAAQVVCLIRSFSPYEVRRALRETGGPTLGWLAFRRHCARLGRLLPSDFPPSMSWATVEHTPMPVTPKPVASPQDAPAPPMIELAVKPEPEKVRPRRGRRPKVPAAVPEASAEPEAKPRPKVKRAPARSCPPPVKPPWAVGPIDRWPMVFRTSWKKMPDLPEEPDGPENMPADEVPPVHTLPPVLYYASSMLDADRPERVDARVWAAAILQLCYPRHGKNTLTAKEYSTRVLEWVELMENLDPKVEWIIQDTMEKMREARSLRHGHEAEMDSFEEEVSDADAR